MQDCVSYVDKVALRNAERIHLSIQSNLNGLCFCLLNPETKEYFAFQKTLYQPVVVDYNDLQIAIDALLQKDTLLNLQFESVSCLFISRHSVLIPTGFSEPIQFKFFLEQNTLIHELDEIHYSSLSSHGIDTVFAIPNPLAAKLIGKYNKVRFYHQIVPLLDISYRYLEEGHKTVLTVNIHQEFADIILIQNGKLMIYNTFEINSSNDLLYFLLAISKKYDLNKMLLKLLIFNDTKVDLGNIPFLFPSLQIIQSTSFDYYDFSPNLHKHLTSEFSLLFSLYQCEL
ncbi:MAG: DUF3822 family protein [Bacteroidales bacterium]